jgi:hypothetical protein
MKPLMSKFETNFLKIYFVILICASILSSNINAQKNQAQNTGNTQTTILVWMGCEGTNCVGKTVDATAGGVVLDSTKYNPTVTDQPSEFSRAQLAICTNTGAKIWVSSAPTTSLTLATSRGQYVLDGGVFSVYNYTNISNFHAIRDAAVSSTLFCDYYRQP